MTEENEFKARLFSNIEWISVKDDLPDRVVNVIVSSGGVFGIGFRSFDTGGWEYVFLSKPTNGPVTHWAHIPLGAADTARYTYR